MRRICDPVLLLRAALLTGLGIGMAWGPAAAQTPNYSALGEIFQQPVTGSVAGRIQLAGDVAAVMTILGRDDIRRSGARSLPDLLLRVVGTDVLPWGVSARNVGLRGANQPGNPQLLVLLNGRQVYLDHFGLIEWPAIPVEMSEILQIEIVRGPQAALFGFNAASGVVNIITANPLYDRVASAEVSIGNRGDRALSAVATLRPWDWLGVRIAAGADHLREDADVTALDGVDTAYDRRRSSFSIDALAQLSPTVQAGIAASLTDLRHFTVEARRFGQNADYQTASLQGRLKATTDIGLLGLSVYHNRLDVLVSLPSDEVLFGGLATIPDPTLPLDDAIDTTNAVVVAQADPTTQLATGLSSRFALEYRQNRLGTTPFDGGVVSYRNYALSAVFDWEVDTGIALTAAGRVDSLQLARTGPIIPPFDNDDYDRGTLSGAFNAGAVWKPDDATTLRLIAGMARQSPTLLELGFLNRDVLPGTPVSLTITGNPLLRQPEVLSYEATFDRDLPALGGRLHLGVFRQKTTDLKQLPAAASDRAGTAAVLTFANNGDSAGWGAEAWLEASVDELSGRLGYVYTDLEFTPTSAFVGQEFFLFNDFAPAHAITGSIAWNHGPLTLDLLGKVTSARPALRRLQPLPPDLTAGDEGFTVDGVGVRFTLQGALTWRITPHVDLVAAATNLHQEDTRLSFGPETVRRFWLTLRAGL